MVFSYSCPAPGLSIMPNVIVVPHSATVVRRPEHLDLQTSVNSIRTRLGKRDVLFPARPGSPQPQRSRTLKPSIVRKLLHCSLELPESKDRHMDSIFDTHAKHQQQELKRRKTDGDLRTRTKIIISAPILSPPAPDEPTLKRHEDRQAEWKERSAALKKKQAEDCRKKRWSLRTWKIESGREQTPKPNTSDQANGSKAAEAVPQSMAKRAWRYSRQKWSFQAVPERLDVLSSAKGHVPAPGSVKNNHGSGGELKHEGKAQVTQRPSISKTFRAQEHPGKYLAVPPRHGTQPVNDQSHIHPALRTNGSGLDLSHSSKESCLPDASPTAGSACPSCAHHSIFCHPSDATGSQQVLHRTLQATDYAGADNPHEKHQQHPRCGLCHAAGSSPSVKQPRSGLRWGLSAAASSAQA